MAGKRNYWLIIAFIVPLYSYGQKRINRPIEISPFLGPSLSFSKLTTPHSKTYGSPPSFGFISGVKVERQILHDSMGLFINTSYTSLELSVSSKYTFHEAHKGETGISTSFPQFDIWSIGLKKVFKNVEKRRIKFNVEFGLRTHIAQSSSGHDTSGSSSTLLDSAITSLFTDNWVRKVTFVPYIGSGFDFQYKRFKVGVSFWVQRSFYPIVQYDMQVHYGSSYFHSKSVSHGMAVGAQVFIKLISF